MEDEQTKKGEMKMEINMERTAYLEQHENGIYLAEIRDEYGDIESACTRDTLQECFRWASERGVARIETA